MDLIVDLFHSAVHNNADLSNSQKLSYLQSSLVGKAHKLFSILTVTDSNYEAARKKLSDSYDNKRVIIREHLCSLSKAPLKKQAWVAFNKVSLQAMSDEIKMQDNQS